MDENIVAASEKSGSEKKKLNPSDQLYLVCFTNFDFVDVMFPDFLYRFSQNSGKDHCKM